ncbi:MAG: hypothetical protein AAFV59_02360 [Pseudomonadota bacterium]
MKLSRISAPVLLVESIAIFCSVLLAFAAEQWRQDMNEKAQADAILVLVQTELTENLTELERVSLKREAMLDDFIGAMDQFVATGEFPTDLPDYDPPEITNVAYQLATDSGVISRIEPGDLIIIAQAYEALAAVKRNETFLSNRNAQIRFGDAEQYLSGFIYFTNQAMTNEPAAILSVKDAIERL